MKNQCLKTFFYKSKLFSFNQISRITLHKIYQLPIKMQGSFTGDQKNWLNKKNIFSNKSKIILLKSKKIIDLDTISDWKKFKIKK